MSLKSNLLKQFCQKYSSKNLESLRCARSSSDSSNNISEISLPLSSSSSSSTISTEESSILKSILPICVNGTVIHGFGRGSKELGIPTANYAENIVENLPPSFETGIYYCWAQVVHLKVGEGVGSIQKPTSSKNFTKVLPAVMSIGWNPYYNNEKKSMETHIIHKFDQDWYESQLRVMIVGRIRGETNFNSLEALIKAINKDISDAEGLLTSDWSKECKSQEFFL